MLIRDHSVLLSEWFSMAVVIRHFLYSTGHVAVRLYPYRDEFSSDGRYGDEHRGRASLHRYINFFRIMGLQWKAFTYTSSKYVIPNLHNYFLAYVNWSKNGTYRPIGQELNENYTFSINNPHLSSQPLFQVFESFYNFSYAERYGEPMPSALLAFLWPFTVAVMAVGGMIGALTGATLSNAFGM